jgi:hypothetical protein
VTYRRISAGLTRRGYRLTTGLLGRTGVAVIATVILTTAGSQVESQDRRCARPSTSDEAAVRRWIECQAPELPEALWRLQVRTEGVPLAASWTSLGDEAAVTALERVAAATAEEVKKASKLTSPPASLQISITTELERLTSIPAAPLATLGKHADEMLSKAVASITGGRRPTALVGVTRLGETPQEQLEQLWQKVVGEIPDLKAVTVTPESLPRILSALSIDRLPPPSAPLAVQDAIATIDRVTQGIEDFSAKTRETRLVVEKLNEEVQSNIQTASAQLKSTAEELSKKLTNLNIPPIGKVADDVIQSVRQIEGQLASVRRLQNVLSTGTFDVQTAEGLLHQVAPLLPPDLAKTAGTIGAAFTAQKQLVSTVTQAFSNPSSLLSGAVTDLAASVGIPPSKEFKALQQGITGLATGNYLQAATAVAGALGLMPAPGDDAQAAARHQEIMGALKQMDRKLDQLLEGQQKILGAIGEVSKQIRELQTLVVSNHQEVMSKLAAIEERTILTGIIASRLELSKFQQCEAFTRAPVTDGGRLDYAEMRKVMTTQPTIRLDQFGKCFEFFGEQDNEPQPFAVFQYVASTDVGIEKLRATNHPFARFRDQFPHTRSVLGTAQGSSVPARLLRTDFYREAPAGALTLSWSDVEQYYRVESVARFGESALAIAAWSLLQAEQTGSANLLEPTAFDRSKSRLLQDRKEVARRDILNPALQLVERALVQQAVLSGQGIAEETAARVNDPFVKALLASNPMLAENVARFLISKAARGYNWTEYLYQRKFPAKLKEGFCKEAGCDIVILTKDASDCYRGCAAIFKFGNDEFRVALPDDSYDLNDLSRPVAAGFASAAVTPDFTRLANLRRDLLVAIADYGQIRSELMVEYRTRALAIVADESRQQVSRQDAAKKPAR